MKLGKKFDYISISNEWLEEFYSWREDPFAKIHNPFASCDFSEFSEIMIGFSNDLEELYQGKNFKWMVMLDEKPLSLIGIKEINKMMKTAEIGYQISPEFRNKGFGTKIVGEFVQEIFKLTDLRKMIAYVSDQNIPSCRILEKIGFIQEGLLRKHYLVNGIETDERVYGILRTDIGD